MSNQRQDAQQKLTEINAFILKLDESIRAKAFDLIAPLYFDKLANPPSGDTKEVDNPQNDEDMGAFFSAHSEGAPAENVHKITAWLYSQHGKIDFTASGIEKIAGEVGLTVPTRIDMTIRAAQADGKTLFVSAGRGKFTYTVHGETYLKTTYGVKKGTKPLPT